ncbi:toxin-antitoxin system YwqK family antitoxin [Olleya sp. YS]|uniref:toxin-antitoxin system YwqK family antitoxin n=1 Tax=Olleya sp. YS TaxID=3028318 RepID=UPI0024342FDC|nr:toxin-antitoxin system YwqK family antitoxin [Olleya sp. YS]WGD34054.1 toxin-antitoxin system YwqK family antitoxin [Olleya sp. YS]
MKRIHLVLLFILVTSGLVGQEVNQFDTNGLRHGKWKKNFENTNVVRYEGEFNHGKEIGTFKFYKNIDGKAVLTATKVFDKDTNEAYVTFLASTGKKISEGKMRGRNYIGKWVIYHKNADQVMTEEFYNNQGKLEGVRNVYYLSGQVAEKAHYKNGLLDGESKWFAENGNLIKSINYKADKFHGAYKTYNKDGIIATEGHYRDDVKCCVWKRYKKGELVEEKDLDKKRE